jgi:hypothetical protein
MLFILAETYDLPDDKYAEPEVEIMVSDANDVFRTATEINT